MAGMTSHKGDCRHLQSGYPKTVYLKAGDPTDRYFTNISWSPDEKSVYVIELNRDQNHALLCCYDAETGEPLKNNPLYEEEHTKYVRTSTSHCLSALGPHEVYLSEPARRLQPSLPDGHQDFHISGITWSLGRRFLPGKLQNQTAYPRQLGSTKHPRIQ